MSTAFTFLECLSVVPVPFLRKHEQTSLHSVVGHQQTKASNFIKSSLANSEFIGITYRNMDEGITERSMDDPKAAASLESPPQYG